MDISTSTPISIYPITSAEIANLKTADENPMQSLSTKCYKYFTFCYHDYSTEAERLWILDIAFAVIPMFHEQNAPVYFASSFLI